MPDFDWAVLWYAAPYMLQGALVTLEISICALILGTVVGLVCGLVSVSDLAIPKAFVRGYVYFVRGTPALVQIFLIYFALPAHRLRAVTVLERGGGARVQRRGGHFGNRPRRPAIDRGPARPRRRCRSAMTNRQSILFILLPQSLRRITPPLTNEVITLVKSSSLLSVISITELTRSAAGDHRREVHAIRVVRRTGRYITS
ncbi:MAG: ABC transporter permease subunit [Acetobacteraceae bacterium]